MRALAGLIFLALAMLGAAPAHANCTAPCTKAQITTDINTNWPDNITGAITPAVLRSTVLDLVNSYLDVNGSSSFTCPSSQWLSAITTLSSYTCTQPNASDIANGAALTGVNDTNVTASFNAGAATALLNAAAITFGWSGTLAVARGGTGGGTASGTLLDNITGFASTGMMVRTGAGTYTFTNPTGAVKNNGSGALSQAACGDLSNATSYCSSTVGQLPGTATNNNASAGNIGEYISSSIAVGSAVSLTNNVLTNMTSVSLTAGDWDCNANILLNPAGTTTQSFSQWGLNTTSAVLPTAPGGGSTNINQAVYAGGLTATQILGPTRFSLSGTTTVYAVGQVTFATSTNAVYGFLGCRRAR